MSSTVEQTIEQKAKGLDGRESLKHVLFALIMGVVGAFASIVLCLCVGAAYSFFQQHTWLLWLLPVFGVLSLLLYHVWKLPLNLSTKKVMGQMRNDVPVSGFLAPGILLGTCASMLGGGSVGKEAGALQMGASLGSLLARPFRLRSVYKSHKDECMNGYAAALGMAATFSALFFAPIGSTLFVLELARYKRSIARHCLSILLACFVAYFIAAAIGIGDVITKVPLPTPDWPVVGHCLVIGVFAALAGRVFANALRFVHALTERATKNYYIWVILGGVAFSLLVFFCNWQPFTGSGGDLLNEALRGSYDPWGFAIKLLLTIICLGLWFKGGEIMPSFCIGGLLGASCSAITGASPAFGAAIGAMAFFAAFSKCPLAAFAMGCEIFGLAAAPWLAIAIIISVLIYSPSRFQVSDGRETHTL